MICVFKENMDECIPFKNSHNSQKVYEISVLLKETYKMIEFTTTYIQHIELNIHNDDTCASFMENNDVENLKK